MPGVEGGLVRHDCRVVLLALVFRTKVTGKRTKPYDFKPKFVNGTRGVCGCVCSFTSVLQNLSYPLSKARLDNCARSCSIPLGAALN